MLYFDEFLIIIDICEGTDVNKTTASKKCIICHCQCFIGKRVKFQPNVCNKFHDILVMSMNLNVNVILKIHGIDYRCIINKIGKSEAINLLQNADLTEKKWSILKQKFNITYKNG